MTKVQAKGAFSLGNGSGGLGKPDAARQAGASAISALPGAAARRAPFPVRQLVLGSVSLLVLSLAASMAQAQQVDWHGLVSSDWFDPFNWSGNALPTTASNVMISTTGPAGIVVEGNTGGANEIEMATTGDAALTVRNAGRLASQRSILIGQSKDHTGTATVSGANSLLSSRFTLGVGYEGNGTLLVENGARAQSEVTEIIIGAAAGSKGSATVTGPGSTLFGSFGIQVGAYGEGTLEVLDGGLASMRSAGNIYLEIGAEAGGKGRVLVSGAGSRIETSNLNIAEHGEGSLTVADGGTVKVTRVSVGTRDGAVGELVVTGAGSSITDGNLFYIGSFGQATLTIANGASVDNDYMMLAPYEGGVGHLLVTGPGSTYHGTGRVGSIGTIDVGSGGAGSAIVSNGGAVVSEHNVNVGWGGSGTVLVTGAGSSFDVKASNLSLGREEFPGETTRGDFTVEAGGATSVAGNALIGRDAVGTGTMTVTGADSTFEVRGNLLAGQAGDGTLSLLDGGVASAIGLTSVGNLAGSTGQLLIDGNGSKLDARNFVFIGNLGEGATAITGGGLLDSAGSVSIGGYRLSTSAGQGAVTVAGNGSALRAAGWIDVGGSGIGSLAIADNALASAGYGVVIGNVAGSTGLLALGAGHDAAGNLLAAAAPGRLDTGDPANTGGGLLRLGDGDATLLFNHTGGNYDFSTPIGGAGLIWQAAGTTILSGDSSAFAGTTRVSGGHLNVQGALGGLITVAGGTLGGNGTLGSVTLTNGGALAPAGLGTLDIGGDVTFNAGSTLETGIAGDGRSGLLAVGGAARLTGGTVAVTAIDPRASYQQGQTYTILTVGGGTEGVFADAISRSAFLTPTLLYPDNKSVQLSIAISTEPEPNPNPNPNPNPPPQPAPGVFTRVADTLNQRQGAAGLDGLRQQGDALAVYNQILMLSAPEARAAFDQSSGEVHAAGQHVIDQTFALFNRNLHQQGLAGLAAGGSDAGDGVAPLAYGPAAGNAGVSAINGVVDHGDTSRQAAWLAPLGGFGQIEGNGNAARLDWWNAGLAGGYEGVIDLGAGHAVAGFGFGYVRSQGNIDARRSSFGSDGFYLGGHGAWASGPWTVAGSLSYGASHVSTRRNIAFIGRTAEASYWAQSAGVSGEVSYGIDLSDATSIAPLFTLDAGWSGHGGFTETGAGALNLTAGPESWARLDAGLGLALTHAILTESGTVTLEGRAAWEHGFAAAAPSQALTLAGSPTGFAVHGPAADRNRLRLGAGLTWEVSSDVTLRARYDGLFSGSQAHHAGSIGLNVKF